MSDIIKRLPTGANFKATSGSNSLQSKFRHAAKAGGLKQFAASQEAIIKLAKKRQSAIQKGTYSKSQVDSDVREVVKSGNFSNQGKRDVRKMFTTLSKGGAAKKSATPAKTAKPSKAASKKAQFHPDPRRGVGGALDFMKKPSSSISSKPGQVYNASGSGGGIKGASSSTSGTTASAAAAGGYKPPALKL